MIFVTIGSMFPFDRLIRLVDDLAPGWPGETFLAQIGRGDYEPRNMEHVRSLPAPLFAERLMQCRLLVAHAGMGSVISALEARRPIVIMPRDMRFGEHTTDHQMATARWLQGKQGVHVALDDKLLQPAMMRALEANVSANDVSTRAPMEFIAKIRDFIDAPALNKRTRL